MNVQLNHMIAQQRSAELQRAGERARLASEVPAERRNSPDPNPITRLHAHLAHLTVLQHGERAVGDTRFTVHGRHIAKLDRFVGQAQRAALRAGREFEGVSIELDDRGTVSVHATGMTSMLL
jgi:hypothetical protein